MAMVGNPNEGIVLHDKLDLNDKNQRIFEIGNHQGRFFQPESPLAEIDN